MSASTISPRLTVLLSDLCIQDRGHRSLVALGLIDDVRRLETQSEFLKRRIIEQDTELTALRADLQQLREALAKKDEQTS